MERFQALTETSMKMAAAWDVAPCSLVDIERRFRGACCLNMRAMTSSRSQPTPPTNIGIKNAWRYTSIIPYVFCDDMLTFINFSVKTSVQFEGSLRYLKTIDLSTHKSAADS
jgi:hypothetical protein